MPIMYRTNFFTSIFDVKPFIRRNLVYVNKQIVNYINYTLKVFDVLTFSPEAKTQAFRSFVLKSYKGTFLFNTPRYLFINYKLLYVVLVSKPHQADLAFPIKIDLHRATGYY